MWIIFLDLSENQSLPCDFIQLLNQSVDLFRCTSSIQTYSDSQIKEKNPEIVTLAEEKDFWKDRS